MSVTTSTRYRKPGSLYWAMHRLWRLDRTFVFFIFATVPVSVVLPLVQSYFAKRLLDLLGQGASFAQLAGACTGWIALILALTLLKRFIESRCTSRRYYPTILYQDEMAAYQNYHTAYENTEKQDFRELHGYARTDATQGNCSLEFLWQDLSRLLINLLGIAAYASLLAFVNPLLLGIVALVSILSYFTSRWQTVYYEKHKHEWEKENRKKSYLQGLSDDFQMAKDIKLYGLEEWLGQMLTDYQRFLLMWNRRCSLRGVWAAALAGLMTLVQDGAAYAALIALLFGGSISVGDFVFYFGIVTGIAAYLNGVMADAAALNTRADKIAYYRALFDYPDPFNHGAGCPLPQGAVTIEFRNVCYRYAGAQEDTIHDLDLTIGQGESIALVGLNGAGKTTLVKLICGLYRPTKGDILVNGRRIEEYNIEEYYTLISAVFQEIKPVAFTIHDYVASSDPERTAAKEDVLAALDAAGLLEKIETLPHGVQTHLMKGIYDDGVDFSGGEMQKLLLSRAIYKNGSILILDEPTAALDPIAENQLYLQYRQLTAGKTSIYISHRFASTRFCDRIILLENGAIRESGTHDELMRLNGQYARMFLVQSKYYKEGEVCA